MRVLTAEQMRDLDRQAIEEIGIPGLVLMENAGRASAEALLRAFADRCCAPVLILCGKGNNGGDGFVVARHLRNRELKVEVLVLAPREKIGGDAAVNLAILERCGQTVRFVPDDESLAAALVDARAGLIVDALFGTGLSSEVRGHYRRAIDWINASGLPVVAIDIPSGVDAGNGHILGRAVQADLTLTFAAAKLGHLLSPGAQCCGRLEVIDIGIPKHLRPRPDDLHLWTRWEEAATLLPERPATGHKGTFGHLLVIAGSRGKTGAAILAAEAGLRGGCGLLTLATAASAQPVVAAALAEAMTEPLADDDGGISVDALPAVRRLLEGKAALALGPGLGQTPRTAAFVRQLVADCGLPLVLDADALNLLAADLSVLAPGRRIPPVMTPHPGEMARLVGCSVAEVEQDRVAVARTFAVRHGVVLVLKGAPTLVAAPDGRIGINGSGGPVLATAGSGDVLTGLIGALIAQGLAPFEAARLGCYLHGLAGDRLARRHGAAGVLAGDICRELPAARAALNPKGETAC
ncbi:NAD(P)H-hydrate epimerase [Geothermobacter ehrlichii]|uniref:Bifunctional NAD(P)H-hydrate repair enzyme n=1 Tax=Geothermobacter ehrlichii TaxID=213224 RepID=A0A5D3WG81_9BACT|nr:NAD(P)H-hydrate dehydratase [Geothermobacter ehrlichii]TYO95677.1 NAD(P)H-hydrate epimerase [Geothermobacter ehrlichii]